MVEIKKAVGALSVNEREELLTWLLNLDDDWDRQMAKDAVAGKLDFSIEGRPAPIPEEHHSTAEENQTNAQPTLPFREAAKISEVSGHQATGRPGDLSKPAR